MTYGLECAFNCSKCRSGTSCHHINGTCIHGCADGLHGDMCQEECSLGYYGQNCLQQCSENCYVTSRCDRVTGQCDRGCKSGWTTITCKQRCEIGNFGPDCSYKCGHCLNASHCHHINGSCLNGCSRGYKGEGCKESCHLGYFGRDCLHKCSTYCSGNGSCSPITGVCDEGCKDGWSGSQCGTPINTDGPIDIDFNMIGIVSGLVISIGIALFSAWLKCRKARSSGTDGQHSNEIPETPPETPLPPDTSNDSPPKYKVEVIGFDNFYQQNCEEDNTTSKQETPPAYTRFPAARNANSASGTGGLWLKVLGNNSTEDEGHIVPLYIE